MVHWNKRSGCRGHQIIIKVGRNIFSCEQLVICGRGTPHLDCDAIKGGGDPSSHHVGRVAENKNE